jgi:hypothetical protein
MTEDDEEARRKRAQELHQEIDAMQSGRARPGRPTNPRDFVEEKAREESERARRALAEKEQGEPGENDG